MFSCATRTVVSVVFTLSTFSEQFLKWIESFVPVSRTVRRAYNSLRVITKSPKSRR